jgi:hypothetical protein
MIRKNLFAPFFYQTNLSSHKQVSDLCLNKFIENYNFNPNHSKDWNAHNSFNDPHLLPNEIDWNLILDLYRDNIAKFIYEFFKKEYDWELMNIWYNVYGMRQDGMQHEHIGADFSVIHYLKFDPKIHKATTFINPNFIATKYLKSAQKTLVDKMNEKDIDQSFYQEKFTIDVAEGDLIIFPSHLEHLVERCESDDLRVTIAFNFKIK